MASLVKSLSCVKWSKSCHTCGKYNLYILDPNSNLLSVMCLRSLNLHFYASFAYLCPRNTRDNIKKCKFLPYAWHKYEATFICWLSWQLTNNFLKLRYKWSRFNDFVLLLKILFWIFHVWLTILWEYWCILFLE